MEPISSLNKEIVNAVIEAFESYFGIEFDKVDRKKNKYRGTSVVFPRQAIEYVLKEMTNMSGDQISSVTGGDRAGIYNSVKAIDWYLKHPKTYGRAKEHKKVGPFVENIREIISEIKRENALKIPQIVSIRIHKSNIDSLLEAINGEMLSLVNKLQPVKESA